MKKRLLSLLLKSLSILLLSIAIQSCKPALICCDPSEGIPTITYTDSKGNSILSDSALGYNQDSVKLFYLNNDTLTNFYGQGVLIAFYMLDTIQGKPYARSYMGGLDAVRAKNNNPYVSLFINLKPNVMDTLTCYWNQNKYHYDSIWYNGVYEASSGFTIVKTK